MTGHSRQSSLRYPLTEILGSVACVRTLRELARHGGELSAPIVTRRTGLAKRSVQSALVTLEALNVVEAVGFNRTRLFRVRREHPLAVVLKQLFAAEEQRFDAVLEAIRGAAEKSEEIIAVWVYGSVARGEDRAESDVDIAVVCEKDSASVVGEAMRETLREAEDRLAFVASVITIDTGDMQRLMATNDPWWRGATAKTLWVAGPSLDLLLRRMKRRATEHAGG